MATEPKMHILVVKHGALGDVVRTSYFASALRSKWGDRLRLSWITAPAAVPLIRFNPHIDDLWTSFDEARPHRYDRIYSLDDEAQALEGVAHLDAGAITGALLLDGRASYSEDSASWFDMGLLSRFGKERADEMKRLNQLGHAEIFSQIFGVEAVTPEFFGNVRLERWAGQLLSGDARIVGINPFAGGRWPSKEMRLAELELLVDSILAGDSPLGSDIRVMLIGAGADRERNLEIAARRPGSGLLVPNTDDSVLRLAALIGRLSYMITSDSLAMHLAISQRVPTTAFFAPTSAPEIDDFGWTSKVVSTASDYCNYSKVADNSSITAERVIAAIRAA